VQHRYDWLYLYGYVHPQTGRTEWHLLPRVNTNAFNLSLEHFAQSVGAGEKKIILLIVDNAGWHTSDKLVLPEGIYLEFLPAYSPELQPAERLWSMADEPLVNRHFESIEELEEVLAQRCCVLSAEMKMEVLERTYYHWWPETEIVTDTA
jgi:transposase